jgi:hypothetical protein
MTMTPPLPTVRSRTVLWITAAILIAIAAGFVLPPASSHHVVAPTLQWVTSL